MSKKLYEIIEPQLRNEPQRKCYWWKGCWHTREEFLDLVDACTEALSRAGFDKGQKVATLLPNGPMTLALHLAVWRLDGVLCPLNEKSGEASLVKTLALLRPFSVIVSDGIKPELANAIKNAGHKCCALSQDEPLLDFEGESQDPEPDIAVIFSTSGTTGAPKAVPLTESNMIDQFAEIMIALPSLNPDDIFLNVLPNFHAFGFTVSGILPLYIGASTVLLPGFMPPQNTLRAIKETRVSVLLLVPTMLGFITSLLERAGEKIDSVRILITGGDRYNISMEPRVKAAFGLGVLEGYGITECAPVLAVNSFELGTRLGTVGPALPNYELQLRDENGKILDAQATEGVMWVRGPSVTPGYYKAPELNSERFDNGWFNTGDFVRLDGRYVTILDRVTDIIIVGGFNVYPQEVEAILSEHPAVQTAVVVGTPNDISGEMAKAFIIKRDAPDAAKVSEADIIRFCKQRLSHYKVPRAVEFVTELPLSPAGKILRRVLRDRERQKQG